jgi:hypothetical protein
MCGKIGFEADVQVKGTDHVEIEGEPPRREDLIPVTFSRSSFLLLPVRNEADNLNLSESRVYQEIEGVLYEVIGMKRGQVLITRSREERSR